MSHHKSVPAVREVEIKDDGGLICCLSVRKNRNMSVFMSDGGVCYNNNNNNNSNLYSAFLNTQRRFTWGPETVTSRNTTKMESRENKQTGHIDNNKKGKQTGEAV